MEATVRLEEIVSAIRDMGTMTSRDWHEKYPQIYELAQSHPLSVQVAASPWDRRVHNLQVELQLRTAELLCAQQKEATP